MITKKIAVLLVMVGLGFSSVVSAAGNTDENPIASSVAAVESVGIALPVAAYQPVLKRPALLPAMWAVLGATQAWDAMSTTAALKAGAREGNPMASPFVKSPGSMLALKATTTASTIFLTERMWRKNRTGAIVLLAVINGATAAVAMHNQQNAARLTASR